MLFLCSERDVFANFGEHLRGDAEERGEVLQGKMLNNTGTTLQQQLIAFAGCGAVEVEVAGAGLTEQMLSYDTAQLHLFSVLTEKVHQLFAADTDDAAGHHCLDRGLRWTTVEVENSEPTRIFFYLRRVISYRCSFEVRKSRS